ncbi:Fosmidomycin resistance protein [hydrothermal vent metagenome]|jgi:MFS family permease|uniref:Fosmidomycin resistance protein n=1 Tax=hydrothermal vent metagenome TaxID=652676 RepID=A0A170PRE3_9ZZZZ|tara:strand:- start:9366 stop:10544 length:1179 start_codon:yes stop_codon:yes gene_type:complete
MGLVGLAHASSHFFHLVLPPLFPILKQEFDVSYAQLGLLPGLFFAASGVMQIISGFLVDQFGARRVLLAGLVLLSISMLLCGLVSEFWMLIPLAVVGGIGNSVFHPADLAILTDKISRPRLGRAYGIHALSGNIGWAAAPVFIMTVVQFSDWRTALVLAGCVGFAVLLVLLLSGTELVESARHAVSTRRPEVTAGGNVRMLLSPTVVSCFLYFTFLSTALIGIQTFGVTAMVQIYSVPLTLATTGLTLFLVASGVGVVCGGFAADWTDRHDVITMLGMTVGAIIFFVIGSSSISSTMLIPALIIAGFVAGTTTPSRDMLVRKVTPEGASGRVFGFVYSGLDLGSCMIPLILGWVLDYGSAPVVFYIIGSMLLVTVLTVVNVRRYVQVRRHPV